LEALVFRKSLALSGLRISAVICLFVVTAIAVFNLSGCGGSSQPVSVAVTASAATVDATDAVTLTATVSNDKSPGGVTWTVSGGGTLSNQSTTGVTYTAPAASSSALTVTVTATSVADTTKTGTSTLTVPAAPAVTTGALAAAAVGTPYSATLAASGGIAPYAWTITSGTLPACLAMNSAGVISGTPTASCVGTANLTFKVMDSGIATALSATSASLGLTINAAPAITFTGSMPGTATYSSSSPYVGFATATGGAGALTYSVASGSLPPGLILMSTSNGEVGGTPTAVGTFPFTMKAADNFGDSNTQAYTITVNQASQTITFGSIAAQTVGTPLTLSASASSSLPVSFASTTSSVCTVSGTTATMLTSGTCTIQATQAGNVDYTAATPVSETFTVNGEAQTITFGSIPAQNVNTPLTLSATASSGLAVSFASTTSSVCSVSGTTASMLATGTCTIQATQAGNSTYAAATPVSQSFTVNGLAQSITFGAIASQTVATPLTLSASASSGLAVSFASTTASVCTVSGTAATMLTSGTCTIQATQAGNSTYAAATPVSQSFTVNGEAQSITFNAIPTQTVATPLTLSATASSGLAVSFASTTTGVCTVSGATATMLTSGTCNIQATQAGNSTYAAATPVSQSFTVNTASQTITFGTIATQTVATPLTLSATATSGLPVSFASMTTGVCTVSGTTAAMVTSGTCTIQATQAGNISYSPATPVSQSFTVNAASQTITFGTIATQNVATPLTLSATATSGLAVSFASTTTGVCTVSGTTATMLTTGTCTIQATQAGNASYLAATPVSQTFTVNGLAQTITFGPIAPQTVGTPLTLSATASSSLAVSFASTTTSVCTVAGTTATMLTSGTCTIQATQPGNSTYAAAPAVSQSFTVNGLAQTITFGSIANQTVGTPLTLSATASSTLAVSFASTTASVCTVSGTTATMLTSGTCTIQATQAGNSTYAAATPVSQSFSVNAESQTITFGSIATQTVGTPLTLSATASSGLTVNFASTTASVCTASGTTATMLTSGTCTIQATQPGNASYAAATPVSQSFTVNAASQTINFGTIPSQTVGTPLTLSATATSGLTVSFASTTGSVCTVSGTTATMLTPGTCTIQATQPGNASYLAATPVSQSFTVNSAGSQVSGQINLSSNCGGGSNVPVITVKLYTSPGGTLYQTVSTDNSNGNGTGNGTYSFSSVPNGNYTITPSLAAPGASSLFYPASLSVTVNNSNQTTENFGASLGYTVSGTVSYTTGGTAQTGQTYLALQSNSCGGSGGPGTSITEGTLTSGGAFTIRGVPPGTYTLQAWMDTLGQGLTNATDPTSTVNSTVTVTVTNASLTGQAVVMGNPTFATPAENPTISGITPNAQGVLINFSPSKNGNGVEDANQYTVQWSTSPTLGGGSGGGQFACAESGGTCPYHTFKASGGNGVWLLDNAVLTGSGFSFTSGQTYYFQARSFNTLDTASPHPSGWCNYTSSGCSGTSGFTPVTIATPSCSGTCTTVSSSVTIPSGITCPSNPSLSICPGAPLYLGLLQFSNGTGGSPSAIYAIEIANPQTGVNQFPQSITVPSGSNYAVFGILDQNNSGGIGAGAVTNVRDNITASLTISGSSQTVPGITLPTANSLVQVQTQYTQSTSAAGSSTNYQLNFEVREANRLPVAVTLTSGPNVIDPVDMSNYCQGCGNTQFQYSATLPGGTPNVGDPYNFTVTYSDGTQDTGTTVNGVVTAWDSANGGASVVGLADLATGLAAPGTGSRTQPNFTWTYPANASDFTYSFYLCCSSNSNIWQIPGNNSKSNGFTVAQDEAIANGGTATTGSIPWNEDPSGSSSSPTGSLISGDQYTWTIQVQDGNGNQASTQVNYTP